MTNTCGCCDGPVPATPADTRNLPGLPAVRRRVGTYASFLASMRAELARADRPALAALRTRAVSDPAIALLDAWAVVADVLTFYQERLANEAYLRTATERDALVDLSRLIGYVPRPGVSATVYLAYTTDDNAQPVEIPAGSKAQDVPDPGQAMQTFETAEPLLARTDWNEIVPRQTRPVVLTMADALAIPRVRITGATRDLKTGDRLLFALAEPARPDRVAHVLRRVATASSDFDAGVTEVALQPRPFITADAAARLGSAHDWLVSKVLDGAISGDDVRTAADLLDAFTQYALGGDLADLERRAHNAQDTQNPTLKDGAAQLQRFIEELVHPADPEGTQPPPDDPQRLIGILDRPAVAIAASSALLARRVADGLSPAADAAPQLLARFHPRLGDLYYRAWRSLPPVRPWVAHGGGKPNPDIDDASYEAMRLAGIHVLRATASLFGYNAPRTLVVDNGGHVVEASLNINETADPPSSVSLESVDEAVAPGSLLLIDGNARGVPAPRTVAVAREVSTRARSDYGLQARTTFISLGRPGRTEALEWRIKSANFDVLRQTLVHVRSEQLPQAEDPIEDDVAGDTIELGDLLDGLQSGRRLIVSGERTDVRASDGSIVPGLEGRELAMLAAVVQGAPEPGDRPHTTLKLASPLGGTYRRTTVRIRANVVKATHGETHRETLGNGTAAQALQTFPLKQAPLTFVSAPTPSGVQTTLEVRVNQVRWHETDSLAFARPSDRVYVVDAGPAGSTATFGNGERGARLPTGTANVRATYRSGIGQPGNVKADRITLLAARPLGVREVTNPLRASGGADAETHDQVRQNAPTAVAALDRLVGVPDYADFARTFGGVGHAAAALLSDGVRQIVHVTVAGIDDIPIDAGSDLLVNLAAALRRYGDPAFHVRVASRELLALVLSASVAIDPDYLWDDIAARLRAALVGTFAASRRRLGQSAYLSEVLAAMQAVRGVRDVDVDVFDAVSEADLADPRALRERIAGIVTETGTPAPGQPRALVRAHTARVRRDAGGVRLLPAQLAFLVPDVPDTLVLNRR